MLTVCKMVRIIASKPFGYVSLLFQWLALRVAGFRVIASGMIVRHPSEQYVVAAKGGDLNLNRIVDSHEEAFAALRYHFHKSEQSETERRGAEA